jgi:type I restriction enzyme, S subunit
MTTLVALSEIAEVNPRLPPSVRGGTGDRLVPFLPMSAVSEAGFASYQERRPLRALLKGYTYFERGDVLVAKITPCLENGKAALVADLPDAVGFGSTEFHVLRPRPGTDARYLFHAVWNNAFRYAATQSFTGSAGQKRLPASFFDRFKIPVPSLAEQRRIAAILDKADAIRRKRRESLRLLEDLLRSAFLDVFGHPANNPMRWELVPLGDLLADIRYGTSVKCTADPGRSGLPVLRIPNVIGGQLSWEDLKYADLSQEEADRYRLIPGDLLFVRTNGNPEYIGRCTMFDGSRPALFASYLLRGRPNISASYRPLFLKHVLSTPAYRVRLAAASRTTAGNYNISIDGISRLSVIRPPLELQDRYLELDQHVTRQRKTMVSTLDEADRLFDSLAQRAFRGAV